MMDDEELGLNTFIKLDDTSGFITISRNVIEKKNRMQLNEVPFVKQRAIVCRGTTCFRNSDQIDVVKFLYTFDKRSPEANHLRLAREKGVEGIARLIGYQRIIKISELRSELIFSSLHRFQDEIASATTFFSQTQDQSFDSIQNLSISKTSSKRKRPKNDESNRKRFKSNSQKFKLSQQYEATQTLGEPVVNLCEFDDDKYNG